MNYEKAMVKNQKANVITNNMNIHLKQEIVEGLDSNFLEFQNGVIIVKIIVYGRIVNSVPSPNDKENLLKWKQTIAKSVYMNKTIGSNNPEEFYAISLNMRFDRKNHHGF